MSDRGQSCWSLIETRGILVTRLLLDQIRKKYQVSSIQYRASSMIVGVMTAHLSMQGVTSLKAKRSIVKGLIGRLKNRFNISVSEVDHQDSKTSSVIAIAIVCNESRFIDEQFDSIINFMRNDGRFYLGQIERETFS